MKRICCLIGALSFSINALANDGLQEEAVQRAIEVGRQRVLHRLGGISLGSACWDDFHVLVEGAFERVAKASYDAAREYRAFTSADVTAEMVAPTLTFTAVPGTRRCAASDARHRVAPATRIVLRAHGSEEVIQPVAETRVPVTFRNGFGQQYESAGVVATFARDAVPPTDVEVIVVTHRDEVRYRIASDAWGKLHH